jgi:hypothetical protein
MSNDKQTQEATQPEPKKAPAAASEENTQKDKSENTHSFQDWASI